METSPPHWPAAVAFSAPCPVAPNAGYFIAASPSRAASLTRRPSARRRPCRIVRARAHSPRPLLAQRQAPRFAQELFFALRNPYTAGFALTAACAAFGIGWLLSSRVSRVHVRRLELAAANSATRPMAVARDGDDDDDAEENTGDNALWLNLSLFPSAWRLFRKNTATLISQTLQPILDKVELPDFIKRVEIRALTIGSRPPLVRKIRRLPSRARSELQYSFMGRLVGDLKIDLDVYVSVFNIGVRCPVTVTDLDVDSSVWCGFSLMPAAPFVRRIQWALLKLPTVKLNIKVANVVPVTAIPILSTVLNVLFTKAIPKEFLLPRTQIVDLQEGAGVGAGAPPSVSRLDLADAVAVTADGDISTDDVDTEELRRQFPALWALFDSMDEDGDGALSVDEVVVGLSADWGFASTSEADKRALFNLLDEDDDGMVSFSEFVNAWPDLRSVFVPRRFDGVIAGVLQKGKNLPVPRWGYSNPFVVFNVESTSVPSKKNFDTSKRGKLRSDAVWNEGWELEVQNPEAAVLTVELREGSLFAFGFPEAPAVAASPGLAPKPRPPTATAVTAPSAPAAHKGRLLGTGRVRVQKLRDGRPLKLWIPLDRGGNVLVDMNYAQYVDPRPL